MPRAGYSLFESKFPEAGKKGRKFVAGINVDGVNSAMDVGRGIVDKIAGPETIERKEKRQEQEDYLNDFFNHSKIKEIIKL